MRAPALFAVAALVVIVSACGSASPSAPSTTPSALQLAGTVRTGGLPMVGATVKIIDGPNANKASATDATGHYALTSLAPGGFTLEISATGYATVNRAITLTANTTADVDLIANLRAFLASEGGADGVLQSDGTYAFTLGMTNTGDGCAGTISGSTSLRNGAHAVLTVAAWTAPSSLLVRPAGHASYTVNGITSANAFGATEYTTVFTFSTVPCP